MFVLEDWNEVSRNSYDVVIKYVEKLGDEGVVKEYKGIKATTHNEAFKNCCELYKLEGLQVTTNNINELKYVPFSMDGTRMFVTLSLMDDKAVDEMFEALTGDVFTPTNIIYKRYLSNKERWNLPEIDKKVFIASECFELGSPGKAVLYLIDILGRNNKERITFEDISMIMYPMGFFDDASARLIINEYVKTKKLKYSEMY